MIRKPLPLILLVSALAFQHQHIQAAGSLKDQRLALRSPYESKSVPSTGVASPIDSDSSVHGSIKIKGSKEFKTEINKMLDKIKVELPLFYSVMTHRVDTIHWRPVHGSVATPNHHGKGNIWIGQRDWDYPIKDLRILSIIHEAQHCNTFGDSNEGAARWSSFYYGKKMKLHPFLVNWSRATSLSTGYKPEWWGDNLLNTQLNYKAQPKHDFNTAKYSKDHAGLAAKQGRK